MFHFRKKIGKVNKQFMDTGDKNPSSRMSFRRQVVYDQTILS